MQSAPPIVCRQCGTAVSTGGGRCPKCGQSLPGRAPGPSTPARVRIIERPAGAGRTWLAVAGSAIGLAVLGGGIWHLARTSGELRSTSQTPDEPAAAPVSGDAPVELDLPRAIVSARRHAERWDPEAHLVSFAVSAVEKGRIVHDATIEIEFGRAKNRKLGPKAPLTAERYRVTVTSDATSATEHKAAPTLSIAEPNCPLEEAWRKMVASGVPSTATVSMRYELAKNQERAVWVTTVGDRPELTRTLDANTCAIVAR